MADGLLAMQTSGGGNDGGFIYSAHHLSPTYGDPAYRTAAHSVALYALLRFIEVVPHGGRAVYRLAAQRALDWLDTQLSTSGVLEGLYLGGSGTYDSVLDGIKRVDQDLDVTWASTDNNIAAWWALHLADAVFDGDPYRLQASLLQAKILDLLWSPSLKRFYREFKPTGFAPADDPYTVHTDSLNLHSWGAIWLEEVGLHDLAVATMAATELTASFDSNNSGWVFSSNTGWLFSSNSGWVFQESHTNFYSFVDDLSGYAAFSDSPGYPNAVKNIWSEGTGSATLALSRTEDYTRWQTGVGWLEALQETDGSLRYVVKEDSVYKLIPHKSVIGAAWYIIAWLEDPTSDERKSGIWGGVAPYCVAVVV